MSDARDVGPVTPGRRATRAHGRARLIRGGARCGDRRRVSACREAALRRERDHQGGEQKKTASHGFIEYAARTTLHHPNVEDGPTRTGGYGESVIVVNAEPARSWYTWPGVVVNIMLAGPEPTRTDMLVVMSITSNDPAPLACTCPVVPGAVCSQV